MGKEAARQRFRVYLRANLHISLDCCTITCFVIFDVTKSQIVSSGSVSRFLLCAASVFALCSLLLSLHSSLPILYSVVSALQAPLSLLCTLRSLQQCGTEQDTSPATEQWSDGAVE